MSAADSTKVVHLPLSDIVADYDWNLRSRQEIMASESDGVRDTTSGNSMIGEGTGFSGLVASLQTNGQEVPVIVRPTHGRTTRGQPTKLPWELVCGFRRFTAVSFLNENARSSETTIVPNVSNGCIRAEVRDLAPVEARILNIRENTERSGIKTPNLVWGVRELLLSGLTQTQIGDKLSIGKAYMSQLTRVSTLPEPILEHWRGAEVKIPGLPVTSRGDLIPTKLVSMKELWALAGMNISPDEKIQKYVTIATTEQMHRGVSASIEHVSRVARQVARLVKLGIIQPGSLEWSRAIGPKQQGFPIPSGNLGAGLNARKRLEHLHRLAQAVYEQEMNKPDEEPEDD